MRWGLVPFLWKKSLKEAPATFIVPASGFYEWTGEKGDKQPHLFTAADGAPILAFAGLWDRWRDPASGDELLSCTIVVSAASAWMTPYHDRMPVLLSGASIQGWLDGGLRADGLKPAAEAALHEWPVTRHTLFPLDDCLYALQATIPP